MKNESDNNSNSNWIDLVDDSIRSRQLSLLRTLNSGVLELFWHIGKFLNEHTKLQRDKIRLELATVLTPIYGDHFSPQELSAMQEFAEGCDYPELREVSLNVSWNHILVFNKLKNKSNWSDLAHYVIMEQVSPEQFDERIAYGNLNIEKSPTFIPGRLNRGSMKTYVEVLNLSQFFGDDRKEDFRKLFEPRPLPEINPKGELISQLSQMAEFNISQFRSEYHSVLSIMGNAALDYIGMQLQSAHEGLNSTLEIKDLAEQVAQRFPKEISSEWLVACAEAYKNGHAMPRLNSETKVVQNVGNKQVEISLEEVTVDSSLTYNIYHEPAIVLLMATAGC